MEKIWFEQRNKDVTEKRRNEEMKHLVKEWSDARSRVEGEI